MTTTEIETDLLESIVEQLEACSNMESYRLGAEIKQHLGESPPEEFDHYYEAFNNLETELKDEIQSLETTRSIIRIISDAVTEIDCDWGTSSVHISENHNERTVIEISVYTDRRCDPIDTLYDLKDDIHEFRADLSYEDDGSSGSRYLKWDFELTLE